MAGVTNQLILCAEQAAKLKPGSYSTTISQIQDNFESVITTISSDQEVEKALCQMLEERMKELRALCMPSKKGKGFEPRLSDQITSIGELLMIQIFSAGLTEIGWASTAVDSSKLIITDDLFTNATPIQPGMDQRLRAALQPLLEQGIIPVVSGYIGATVDEEITTLGRGAAITRLRL